jgi:hypothetical protein
MLYIKNELKLKLDEVKNILNNEKILIKTGNENKIKFKEKEIKGIGGEVEIKEK